MEGDGRAWAEALGLVPHPEGGFYREAYRAPLVVQASQEGRARAASTAIYFLRPAGTFSALHRVRSDEVWHHYAGDPVELHTIDAGGAHSVVLLGKELPHERPQRVIEAGTWQAAVPLEGGASGFALCGCTVAPGFEFADFELAVRADLVAAFPQHAALVERLTRA